jgi:hypothetical protein
MFRFGVSDYAAAALANGLLKDYGLITPEDRTDVLYPSKISREKRRISAKSLSEREDEVTSLKCIGLDSKRDADSLVIEKFTEGDKTTAFRTKANVEHLTFTIESGTILQLQKPLRGKPVFRIRISLYADPDPGFYLNADPDSGFWILTKGLFCQKKNFEIENISKI